ncbi:hypothetical protein Ppb6_03619 [Photorhabdus australis subsp. thailandensis]|uniref:Pentapeptide MXKDX repeat protein n=1 Tax=Photorhabdus australis subsp. thailandensis TaxID=2805096 RepID=A0A1C0TZW3_9GAMM|nr:hypothetical protein [Photorhabdus australis]OCQ51210.1 hypothetical protein Ppb6_03619 [Photorhabdus australis subsp. thailandensis]
MTRLGLSVTVLSLLFSGAVLAAPATPMTQSSNTQMTSSHMEKTADHNGKQSDKTTTKHSNHKVMKKKEEAKKTH